MNERNLYVPALVMIALALLTGIVSAEERQITNATVDQVYSTVLDDHILWSDNRTGDYDVYLYNVTEESERALSRRRPISSPRRCRPDGNERRSDRLGG